MVIPRFAFVSCLLVVLALIPGCGGGGGGGGGGTTSDTNPTQDVHYNSVTLAGQVLDASTDTGVANAQVTLTSGARAGDLSTTTDAEGKYTLNNVQPGKASMRINLEDGSYEAITVEIDVSDLKPSASMRCTLTRRGSVAATSVSISPKTITLATGSTQQFTAAVLPAGAPKAFFLVKGDAGTIDSDGVFTAAKSGTAIIVAQAGSQVDLATVTVMETVTTGTISGVVTDSNSLPIEGVTVAANARSATTGYDGSYVIAGLSPGNIQVNATKSGWTVSSKTVSVTAGKTSVVNWTLSAPAPTTGTISGIVTDGSGLPVAGATVSLNPGAKTTSTSVDGTYVFSDLTPGTYTAAFSAIGFVSQSKTGLLVEAGKTTTQDVALVPSVRVSIDGPNTVSLTLSETHTFTATVANATDTRVVWSVTGGGSITQDGLYTAPATRSTATVKASSRADAKALATVTVQVQSGGATVIVR